ncbi:MAG: hypothetical protein ACP5J4_09535 [Anaerolineae bacterium]
MPDIITEALLEMHFHRAIVEHFSKVYGANFLRLLKPSSQKEVWVGFDQGWICTPLTTEQFFAELSQAIQSSAQNVARFYLGYFLQFKTVQKITRKSALMPERYITPYFRSELSVKPNPTTRLSQHETLLRLNEIHSTNVCYACAMLFDLDEIYVAPNVKRLRCVDISSSPRGWATNERHFITFQCEDDPTPFWCSQPMPAVALSFDEWASPESKIGPKKLTAEDVIRFVKDSAQMLNAQNEREKQLPLLSEATRDSLGLLPESLTILEFEKEPVGG